MKIKKHAIVDYYDSNLIFKITSITNHALYWFYKSTTTIVISSWILLFFPLGISLIFWIVKSEDLAAFSNVL